MKFLSFFLLTYAAVVSTAGAGFVFENTRELLVVGDWNGDGRDDVATIDRASGAIRPGYQNNDGTFLWANPIASGIKNVEAAAAGRLQAASTDQLVLTSPLSNRLNRFALDVPNAVATPASIYLPGDGPSSVAALDIVGGDNDAALDDLAVITDYNQAAMPVQRHFLRSNNAFASFDDQDQGAEDPALFNPVLTETATAPLLGSMLRDQPTDRFRITDTQDGTYPVLTELAGLPQGSHHLHGAFDSNTTKTQFLFYLPGDNHLRLSRIQANNTLGALTNFDLGVSLDQVFPIRLSTELGLLVLIDDGAKARLYQFDGINAPVLLQEIDAPAGEAFTGGLSSASGEFVLFRGDATNRLTLAASRYEDDGNGNYTEQEAVNLPKLTGKGPSATVFTFEGEPFVVDSPVLLRRLNAGVWNSGFMLTGNPGNVEVTEFTLQSSEQGLGSPVTVNLGAAHPNATHGLTNQYRPDVSLHSDQGAIGEALVQVSVTPDSGQFKQSVKPIFQVSNPAYQAFWTTELGGGWTLDNGDVPYIFKNSTLSYYALENGTHRRTEIFQAIYTFTEPPEKLDSDLDKVPDFVEIAKGMKPIGSDDSDEDGFNDLVDLLNDPNGGTDPKLPDSKNALFNQELRSAFDLKVTPFSHNGTNDANPLVPNADGSVATIELKNQIGVYRPDATFYGRELVALHAGDPDPLSMHTALPADPIMPLLVMSSSAHFDIQVPEPNDSGIGRHLAGLIEAPQLELPDVNFVMGNGHLETEANAWIAAAKALYENLPRETVEQQLDHTNSLVLLLVEHVLGNLLFDRGVLPSPEISLTPFLPADKEMRFLTSSELVSLQSALSDLLPAYRLSTILQTVQDCVDNPPSPEVSQLIALSADLYRISAAVANDFPGEYPSPFQTLRQFIAGAELPAIDDQNNVASYLGMTTLSANDRLTAFNGVAQVLAKITPRPLVQLTLEVTETSFSGPCIALLHQGSATTYHLVQFDGSPFINLDVFELLPATEVSVSGYTDVVSDCGPNALEVVDLELVGFPAGEALDSDLNLLPDAWEYVFFGQLGQSPFLDDDDDTYANIQELIDGTDPNDGGNTPDGPAQMLIPDPKIVEVQGDQVKIQFEYPAEYVDQVTFCLFHSDDLDEFDVIEIPAVPIGDGMYEMAADFPNGTLSKFYFVQVKVKVP